MGQLDRQVQQERRECERQAGVERELDGRLAKAKHQLSLAREDRRAINLESLSLRNDRNHFADECSFLQQMAADEAKTFDVVQNANQYLEKSFLELEAQTGVLEQQRRELLLQIVKEKDLVRVEERQIAELRNNLERIRRQHAVA